MKMWHRYKLVILSFLGSLLLVTAFARPSQAHWADLSVAEVIVGDSDARITLTLPTGLLGSVDDNQDNQLSSEEVSRHQVDLEKFLGDRLHLTNGENIPGSLAVKALDTSALPSNLKVTEKTHSTLLLVYTWLQPVQGLKIRYDLFLPGVPTARCLATILQAKQAQNVIFSPENREFSLVQHSVWQSAASLLMAIAGAFVWGAMHAMTPGHGKTIVGAYLAGSRATPKHAVFLGLMTTITHTIGVFALGLITLFASRYLLPEQLYPWLSLISGLMVVVIGVNLLISRWQVQKRSLAVHSHSHDHSHDHEHHHHGGHSHSYHSHLPSDSDSITWRSLITLGISGGIVPCPSALVLLLSTVALGNISFGLLLVLVFSLGLAGTLTALGLLLVSSRRLFERIPTSFRLVRILPTISALFVALLGLGVTTQALMEIGLVRL